MFYKFFCFFFYISLVCAFSGEALIQNSLHVVKEHCQKYQIDESHNEKHSKEVVDYCIQMIKTISDISIDEQQVIILSSIFHDAVDHKYIFDKNIDILRGLLKKVLTEKNYRLIPYVLDIISNMSFSKTVIRQNDNSLVFQLPERMKNHPFLRSYHIVRNADLLSSYNLKRAIFYNIHKKSGLQKPLEIFNEVYDLYYKRMFVLRKYNIINFNNDFCKEASAYLEKQSFLQLEFCKENYFSKNVSSIPYHEIYKIADLLEVKYNP